MVHIISKTTAESYDPDAKQADFQVTQGYQSTFVSFVSVNLRILLTVLGLDLGILYFIGGR